MRSWQHLGWIMERQAKRLVPFVPTVLRHPIAKALRSCRRFPSFMDKTAKAWANSVSSPWWAMDQFFLQTSMSVDVQVPCPNCGKMGPLFDAKKLKTYCFDCSDWGHDPNPQKPRKSRKEDV